MIDPRRRTDSEARPSVPGRRRLVPRIALVAVSTVGLLGITTVAGAGTPAAPFHLVPSSGPPTTVVVVSGAGCAPGPVVSSTRDFVRISAPVLGVSFDVAVAGNGSWSGRFTVPSNANVGAVRVSSLCYRDGSASTTTYAPQTFNLASGSRIGTTPSGNAGGAANAAAVAAFAKRPPVTDLGTTTTTTRSPMIWWILIGILLAAAVGAAVFWRRRHHGPPAVAVQD